MREFCDVSSGNQAAGDLHSCGLRFRLPNQTGRTVAIEFFQLVAINREIAARLNVAGAAERPEHGESRRRRHQREYEPESHEALQFASC